METTTSDPYSPGTSPGTSPATSPPTSPAATSRATTTPVAAEDAYDKGAGFVAIAFLFVASATVLIESCRLCHRIGSCKQEYGFAVAAGAIGVFFSFVMFLLNFSTFRGVRTFMQFFAVLLALTWTAGAGILTFRNPFVQLGNGYFASWLAFGASYYLVFVTVPFIGERVAYLTNRETGAYSDHRNAFAILASSVVEITVASLLCRDSGDCRRVNAWAVSAGAISAFVTLIFLMSYRGISEARVFISFFLLLLWIPGCGILTFWTPFTGLGNGYFSSWLAFLFSLYWFMLCMTRHIVIYTDRDTDRDTDRVNRTKKPMM